jgi:hypothetical protein
LLTFDSSGSGGGLRLGATIKSARRRNLDEISGFWR